MRGAPTPRPSRSMHDETPATPAKSDKNLKEFYANTQKDSLSRKFAGVHIDARVTSRVSSANLADEIWFAGAQ